MIDYKEKYEKLLESYIKLEQEKGSGKLIDQVQDNERVTGFFPSGMKKTRSTKRFLSQSETTLLFSVLTKTEE